LSSSYPPFYPTKQALKDAGVDEVVLAINYQPQVRRKDEEREQN